eukprot:5821485-Amphidinium_carterae.1
MLLGLVMEQAIAITCLSSKAFVLLVVIVRFISHGTVWHGCSGSRYLSCIGHGIVRAFALCGVSIETLVKYNSLQRWHYIGVEAVWSSPSLVAHNN